MTRTAILSALEMIRPPTGRIKPQPLKENIFKRDGKTLVSKVAAKKKNLKEKINLTVELIGGFARAVKNKRIFVKPNLNSDDPYPASTDPKFAQALTELLYEHGAVDVVWGDSSGVYWLPTERALSLGLKKAVEQAGGHAVSLDKEPWSFVPVPGLGKVGMSVKPFKFDTLIYAPCMKTHCRARFTLSLKLTLGFVHLIDRLRMHLCGLEQHIADVNTAVHPDLIVMDGRKCFVTKGPARGQLRSPGMILASGDRIAIDVEALKVLKKYKAKNDLNKPIWSFRQIARAVELGLGVRNEMEYEVITN